jgi:hypothetical protein
LCPVVSVPTNEFANTTKPTQCSSSKRAKSRY